MKTKLNPPLNRPFKPSLKTWAYLKLSYLKVSLFNKQSSSYKLGLAEFCESLAQNLRSGSSLRSAVEEVIDTWRNNSANFKTIDSGIKNDLEKLRRQLNLGLETAVQNWADNATTGHLDHSTHLAVTNLTVAKAKLSFALKDTLGGNRTRGIEALARNLREEISLDEEIYALSSQARYSALVIALMPAGIFFIFSATDSGYLAFMFTTLVGLLCLLVGLTLDFLGVFWMAKILEVENSSLAIKTSTLKKTGKTFKTFPRSKKAIMIALSSGIIISLAVSLIIGILFGIGVWYWLAIFRNKRLEAKTKRHYKLALSKELSNLVDFYTMALSSGMTIQLATEVIFDFIRTNKHNILPYSKKILKTVLDEAALGTPFADTFSTCPPSFSPLSSKLAESIRYGGALLPSLYETSTQIKESNRRQLETEIRKIPIKLLFPLTITILPAFGLLTLTPLVVRSLQTISSIT